MAAPRGPRRASPRLVDGCVGPGKQQRGTERTRGDARGTNEEEGGGCKGGLLLLSMVLRAWGHLVPLSAGECALFGQAHAKHAHRWIPPERAQCPAGEPPEPGSQTPPRVSVLEERATLVVGPRGWPSPHHHHHIASPHTHTVHTTLEIGSGRAGARDNLGGAHGGPSTGRPWRRMILKDPKSDFTLHQ